MNNLLIIGNGFDLAHNMKTSYNHFLQYLVNEHVTANKFKDLFNLKGKITDINDFKDENIDQFLFDEDFKNDFIKYMLTRNIQTNNWCDIEYIYFSYLDPTNKISPYINSPKYLNYEFEIIKNHLASYLKAEEKKGTVIGIYKDFFNLIDSKETLILNFNYTDTLKRLYSNEINESKIIHIHGELSNPKNPIIFGYAADDKESRDWIDKKDNEYMRNIKKHLYKRTDNERKLTYYLKGTPEINVTILGHSCGLSDKLILNQILNNENVQSINIFYYEEYELYFQTQVNIDRIMNNDNNFKKLVDFNSSHRMPQHNDTNEQQEDFIKYITPIIEKRKYIKKIYNDNKSSAVK